MQPQQQTARRDDLFSNYDLGVYYDEMFGSPGQPRLHYEEVFNAFAALTQTEFEERRCLADLSFLMQGITCTVYSDGRGTERLFPLTSFRAHSAVAMGEVGGRPFPAGSDVRVRDRVAACAGGVRVWRCASGARRL